MMVFRRSNDGRGGAFTFRVSDVVDVPLRGIVLRLRLVEGAPSEVRIAGHAVTGGKPTQARLDRTRELDVLLAEGSDRGVEIGWLATGPVS
jgi:hypothetical protein